MEFEKSSTSGIKKFDGTEFDVWSTLQEVFLTAKGLWYVIEGEPPTEEKKTAKWENDDRQAKMALLLSLEHEVVKLVISCVTARDIWNRLKATHAQKSESCRMVLYQEFYGCNMQPGQKISDYVSKVEFIAKKLKNAGANLDDETIISKVVTGLTQDFKHFMTTWMGTPAAERTFDNLLQRLLAEESIMRPEHQNESVAMKMSIDKSKLNTRNGGKSKRKCYHCGKEGHIKRDFRSLKREQGERTDSKGNSSKFAIMAKTGPVGTSGRWLVDTGASEHMTADRNILDSYRALDVKVPICVGNNEYVYGIGVGSIKVISTVGKEQLEVTINNVMHVPGISDNLFSAGAADERGIKLCVANGRMDIMLGEKVIMVGNKIKGSNLYTLDVQVPPRAYIARSERTLDEWHRVLGHPGVGEIQNLQRKACTSGFKIVDRQETNVGCTDCQTGKAHQVSHPSSARQRATSALERVHADLVGPINPSSAGGKRYFLLIRDEFSTYLHVYFIASKAEVADMFQKFVNEASIAAQKRVRIIRSDNGSEFRNIAMTHLCQTEGIVQEFSSPHTPMQNGEIERANRSVIESARAMLLASSLPQKLWGEAINTAVYLKNRLTNKRTVDRTPYELFHGKAPDLSHLIEFGQQVHVLDKNQKLAKFQQRTIEAFVVGYGDRINNYRCYSSKKDDVFVSPDVFVAPHKLSPNHEKTQEASVLTKVGLGSSDNGGSPLSMAPNVPPTDEVVYANLNETGGNDPVYEPEPHAEHGNEANIRENDEPAQAERANESGDSENQTVGEKAAASDRAQSVDESTLVWPSAPQENSRLYPQLPSLSSTGGAARGAGRDSVRRVNFSGIEVIRPSNSFADRARTSCVPASNNQTQVGGIVFQAPRQPIVLGVESNATGVPRQVSGLSPRSVINRLRPAFSSVIDKLTPDDERTRRNLSATIDVEPRSYEEALACASKDKWKIAICDELAAHADNGTWELVPKRADMREITAKWIFKIKDDSEDKRYKARLVARGFSQQEGTDYHDIFSPVVRMDSVRLMFSLVAQIGLTWKQFDITTAFLNGEISEELYLLPPEGLAVPDGHTCRLKRSLYGLKQAPRCWNAKFTQMLNRYGMVATQSDPCVYVTRDDPIMYLALYVDDGLIFAKDAKDIDKMLSYLKEHFKVKLIDSACFLGLEIKKVGDGSIFLHQSRYIKRMLQKYNMADCKGKPTPIVPGHALNKPETLNGPVMEGIPYAELVGSLLYCSVATRPDISYSLSLLSKFTSQPRLAHWEALKRVLRYLSATQDFGLLFQRREHPKLECYTDADYAGDHENRRSTSGMITFLASGPISYKAQQQSTVAMSTTEAEYIASAVAAKELVWLQRFLKELKVELKNATEMICDNQSALRLIKNPEFHQRSKHIDVAYHFVREKFEGGLFVLKYVSSEDQKADIFTKSFSANRLEDLRRTIGCVRLEVSCS